MNDNNMPNNFGNNMGNGVDPQGQAAVNLMGGQSMDNPTMNNVMSGQENVNPVNGAFQGVQTVQAQPTVMQGVADVTTSNVNVMPGQGNSGVNAFTMQSEPVVNDSVNQSVSVSDAPAVGTPTVDNSALNMNVFDKINEEVINNDVNANAPIEQPNPTLNSTLMGPGMVNMNANVGMQAPVQNAPVIDPNMVPEIDNNVNQTADNMNVMNNIQEPALDNNLNNNTDSQVMMNSTDTMMPNNQIGDSSMMNNQIGDPGMMSNNDVSMNQNMNNNYGGYEKNKKFPLTTREIVLVAIALIGILVVLDMYVFHIVIK